MNKTVLALHLASLSSPLFTPAHSTIAFSLAFDRLKLSHFFSSFVYSNGCSGSIKISRSDFGFFLDTVINIESATHNIINQDLTHPYNAAGITDKTGWITCPSLECIGSLFHDIKSENKGAGGIAYQTQTQGTIKDTTFINIQNSGATYAGALGSNELNPNANKGSTIVSGCCFSNCKNVGNGGEEKFNAFRLASTLKVDVSLTSVYKCANAAGESVCSVQSSEADLITVKTFNSTFNSIGENSYGSGISFLVNANGNRNSKLMQSTFMYNVGAVVFSIKTDKPSPSTGNPTSYTHNIEISECNFISNQCAESIISTVNGKVGGSLTLINIPTLTKDVFINITAESSILDFRGQDGTVVMKSCSGDAPTINIDSGKIVTTITESMYKYISSPTKNSQNYLNTEGCMFYMDVKPPVVKTTAPHVDPPPVAKTSAPNVNTPVAKTSTPNVDPPKPGDEGIIDGSKPGSGRLSGGQIAGIVVGIIAAVAVVGVVAFVVVKKPCSVQENSSGDNLAV